MAARARVIVTVEIELTDNWSENCQISQIRDQAKSSAIAKIRNISKVSEFKIIGEPKVDVIIAGE